MTSTKIESLAFNESGEPVLLVHGREIVITRDVVNADPETRNKWAAFTADCGRIDSPLDWKWGEPVNALENFKLLREGRTIQIFETQTMDNSEDIAQAIREGRKLAHAGFVSELEQKLRKRAADEASHTMAVSHVITKRIVAAMGGNA